MGIFNQNLKLTQMYGKLKNTEIIGYVFGEWTEADYHT
jgi:hypothetical protein